MGMPTTPASSGSLRHRDAASANPSGAASATMKYEPRGSETVIRGWMTPSMPLAHGTGDRYGHGPPPNAVEPSRGAEA